MFVSESVRHAVLHEMLASDKSLYFGGKAVCSAFLMQTCHLSLELQSRLWQKVSSREIKKPSIMVSNVSVLEANVVFHFQRLANSMTNPMPDKNKDELPFYRLKHIYNIIYVKYTKMFKENIPFDVRVYTVWKRNCKQMKVRKCAYFHSEKITDC